MQPNTNISKEAKESMNSYSDKVKTFAAQINNRVAYKNSYGEGKGVMEWTDPKAKEEMKLFYKEILTLR